MNSIQKTGNKNALKTVCLGVFVCCLSGCQSAQRAVVPGVGDGIVETRDDIARLGDGQTDLAQRETTANLRKSFEKSASDQLTKASEYETEIAALRDLKSKAEIALLEAKNQRNTLFFVLSALLLCFAFLIFVKTRVFFRK